MDSRSTAEILRILEYNLFPVRDGRGEDAVLALPLSFDRVNEGRLPSSTAPLFTLPFEILGVILAHIESGSLAVLALVNRDCLQLARSRQFANIKLDYSDASLGIINKLWTEKNGRADNGGALSSLSFGACIRHMIVSTHPRLVALRHNISLSDDFRGIPEDGQTEQMVQASHAFFGTYMFRLQSSINTLTMPHLELLDWKDDICLPPSFYTTLALSPIRHLKLRDVIIDEEVCIKFPQTVESPRWPLRSLHLGPWAFYDGIKDNSASTTVASILRLCAPTLETLYLWSRNSADPYTFANSQSHPEPRFSKLRHLTIGNVLFEDYSMLTALIVDSLRTLDIDMQKGSAIKEFFWSCGSILALESFVWRYPDLTVDQSLEFLRANPQISKLAIPQPKSSELLELKILPILTQSFLNLSSLSLIWDDASINDSALEMISTLVNLNQIHLSSGKQDPWFSEWLIDHDMMRRNLSKIPHLEGLAFSCDTYDIGFPINLAMVEDDWWYYFNHSLPAEEYTNDRLKNNTLWEQRHRSRMLSEASQYVSVMPDLAWLYFSQITMQVHKSQETKARAVSALRPEREPYWKSLEGLFWAAAD